MLRARDLFPGGLLLLSLTLVGCIGRPNAAPERVGDEGQTAAPTAALAAEHSAATASARRAAAAVLGEPSRGADALALEADVRWLADPARVGRRAGEPGEHAAGTWIAERLGHLGLAPAGSDGWFHPVDVPLAPRDLGTSSLAIQIDAGDSVLAAGPDIAPLSAAAPGTVRGDVVFAGYGLVAPSVPRDDFVDLDLDGKVVLLVRGAPVAFADAAVDWAGADGLFSKVMAAKRRGAAAVLVAHHPRRADEPLPSFDSGPTSLATLPALSITAEVAERVQPGYAAAVEAIDRAIAQGGGSAVAAPAPEAAHSVHMDVSVSRERGTARNVLGWLRGSDPTAPLTVIGAHYDHLGHGHTGSLAPDRIGEVHPGADDNASGTAVVLELARLLAARGTRGDVLIALWSGEELGLLGSKRWVAQNAELLERTALCINLDMVGRVDGRLTVLAAGSSPVFADILPELGEARGLELLLEPSGRAVGGSDHQSFLERRIPALHLFSGLHGDYHRPSDTADRVLYPGLARVTDFTADVIERIQREAELPFVEVSTPTEPGRARGEGWRVWFGSVPEYGDSGPGLLIGGTSPGSPAERAGLLSGDRIVQVGETVIEGMADFMGVLSIHKPGEVVRVVFERDGAREEVLLTLAAREPR